MRRILLSTIACFSFAIITNAQSGNGKFYMKVTGGYFFSVSPGQFPDVGPYAPRDEVHTYNPGTGATTTVSEKVLTGSYGEGVRGGIAGGYNINKYIAVELSVNYYHSKTNLMTRNVTTVQGTSNELGRIESNGHVQAIDIAPSVVISPGYDKWNPYVRLGFVVPVWGRLYIETDASKTSPVPGQPAAVVAKTAIHRKEEVKPNVTFGFQGAFGVVHPVSKRISIFLEAEYRNVPVKSKSKEVTTYNENTKIVNTATGQQIGPDRPRGLNDLSVAERNTDYVTTLDQSSNTPTGTSGTTTNYKNNNAPANELKSFINIGGMGANLGIKIRM
ncbi:outer membrane beta-barrel protein [Pseudoflavitalea sp. G-6-1-2]|uniref:outer membrane beta-barrel protein n=1 Tax=Pseudoflavitalea sp. G-6-1-2 TaxID=2728841 RepID=UPI00146E0C13|nr:outer membrane beta-barrel protein [Pseudoflavitalea sp. G-6-1-2]NML23130.1 outer membrane beta-barrel protein [Pseudoflavitalea sp. G-6-1-2]